MEKTFDIEVDFTNCDWLHEQDGIILFEHLLKFNLPIFIGMGIWLSSKEYVLSNTLTTIYKGRLAYRFILTKK